MICRAGAVLVGASVGCMVNGTLPCTAVDCPAHTHRTTSAVLERIWRTLDFQQRTKLERLEIRELARFRLASDTSKLLPGKLTARKGKLTRHVAYRATPLRSSPVTMSTSAFSLMIRPTARSRAATSVFISDTERKRGRDEWHVLKITSTYAPSKPSKLVKNPVQKMDQAALLGGNKVTATRIVACDNW